MEKTTIDEKIDNKQLFPMALEVEKGKTYKWCGCGESQSQPLCDKANCGEKAVSYYADLNEEVYFCACKHTKNPPWCDGSHGKIILDVIKNG